MRKEFVPSISLLHATSFFYISSSSSPRSYQDISDVATFSLLMDSTQTTKLLKNAAWNGKIIATLADIMVMDLILSTQHIIQYIIDPTQGWVVMSCLVPQNCLDCCWEAKWRRNFFPETFLGGVKIIKVDSWDAQLNTFKHLSSSRLEILWFELYKTISMISATILPLCSGSQYMRGKVKLVGQMFRAYSSYMTYMVKNLKIAKNDDFDDFWWFWWLLK